MSANCKFCRIQPSVIIPGNYLTRCNAAGATLIVAFWLFGGRLEILVWSIPAMTVLTVGGVAWIGAHDLYPGKSISADRLCSRRRPW